MTASIVFVVITLLLSLFKVSLTQFCPFPNFRLLEQSVCVWVLNDTAIVSNGLFNTIPYNITWAHRTIDTLIYGFKNDGLSDYFKNSGIPYPTNVDIIAELTAIRNQVFGSDWEFQQAVSKQMIRLHDAHSRYRKPACYSSRFPTFIQLPFNFNVQIETSTGRLVYQLDTRPDSSDKFLIFKALFPIVAADLVTHFGEEIVLIDDLPTDVALSAFSNIMGGDGRISNDPSVNKNVAINMWTNQDISVSNAPLKNEIKLTFLSGISINIPYLMVRPASAKQFSISECLKPSVTTTSTAAAKNSKIRSLIKSEFKEVHPELSVGYLEHTRQYPILKDIDDARDIMDLQMIANGNFIPMHNTSDKLNDIPCFATSDNLGRSVLIIELFTFQPKVSCTLFRNSLKTCLSQPYDYVVINAIGNTGGFVTLGYMTIQLLVESAFNNPNSLNTIYDLKHSEFFNLLSQKNIQIPEFSVLINPKTLRKFDNFSEFYYPGRKVIQGGVTSLRSNKAFFPIGPTPEFNCVWTDVTWKPVKFYSKDDLIFLTDGLTGSTGATFVKSLHERNMATFIGMGGNWGDEIDIGSFAGGVVFDYSRLIMNSTQMFLTDTLWSYPVLIAYSNNNNAHPQQFHRNPAQIRLAKWNTNMLDNNNKIDLYKSVMDLVPPIVIITSTPTNNPATTPNCNNNNNNNNNNDSNNYSKTQVILIGVLPVCLLFLIVVVPLLVYLYFIQSKESVSGKTSEIKYQNMNENNKTVTENNHNNSNNNNNNNHNNIVLLVDSQTAV